MKLDASEEGIVESEPAKLTTPEARSVRPLPEPPLPYLAAVLLLDEDGLALDEPELLPDELQAATDRAAARAIPAVALTWMRTRCISDTPL